MATFNASAFMNTAKKLEGAPSTTLQEALKGFAAAGLKANGFQFTSSKKWDRNYLIFGEFKEGTLIEGSPFVKFNIGSGKRDESGNLIKPVVLKGTTDNEKLVELMENYPVYYGTKERVDEITGVKSIQNWMTIAPVGTYEPAKVNNIDFGALLKGSIAAKVA